MQLKNNVIVFSPSDLITFMDSKFASHMERSCVEDNSYRNLIDPEDPLLKSLQNVKEIVHGLVVKLLLHFHSW